MTPAPAARQTAIVIILGFGAVVFEGYDLIVYGASVPALLAYPDWGLTPIQVGAIGSYALFGMFIGAPAAGWLSDRFGRRKLFIGLLAWFSIFMIFVAIAPTPGLLGLFRFLAGLGFGGIPPTAIALVIEFSPLRRRVFFNSVMLSGFAFGGLLASVLSIALIDSLGFRGMFALGALPLVTLVPLAIWLLPESTALTAAGRARSAAAMAGSTAPASTLGAVLRGRAGLATALFAAANFCGFLLVFELNTWLPQIMRQAGFDLGSALSFLLVLNLGSLLGGWAGRCSRTASGAARCARRCSPSPASRWG